MEVSAITTIIAWRPEHVLWSLVEVGGKMWVITDIDQASGATRVERAERYGGHHIDAGYYLERASIPRLAWAPGIVASLAVFLFLALMSAGGVRLTTADILGVVVGFCIIVALLSRREQRQRGRNYGRWYVG